MSKKCKSLSNLVGWTYIVGQVSTNQFFVVKIKISDIFASPEGGIAKESNLIRQWLFVYKVILNTGRMCGKVLHAHY